MTEKLKANNTASDMERWWRRRRSQNPALAAALESLERKGKIKRRVRNNGEVYWVATEHATDA
jgi:hypothetical protein